jgi:hypothetical protein
MGWGVKMIVRAFFYVALCLPGLTGASAYPISTAPLVTGKAHLKMPPNIYQNRSRWQIDYSLVNDLSENLVLLPKDINAKVEGWVSNSADPALINPRLSSHRLQNLAPTRNHLGPANDPADDCYELVKIDLWAGDDAQPLEINKLKKQSVAIAPGQTFHVRVSIEHSHTVYGDYLPLLGERTIQIEISPAISLEHNADLTSELDFVLPDDTWPEIPEDKRSDEFFISAPHSLLLEGNVPGGSTCRLPERNARFGTRMRLTYYYRIAEGTEAKFDVDITQSQRNAYTWKSISHAEVEFTHAPSRYWRKVDKIIKIDPSANTIAVDFRLNPTDAVGRVWIDDVILTTIDAAESHTELSLAP